MKHLRKYNEDINEDDFDDMQRGYKKWEENEKLLKIQEDKDNIDVQEKKDYIKNCFIEFYDKLGEGENGVHVEEIKDDESTVIEMSIDLPNSNYSDDDINVFIEHAKDVVEFYEEIKYCIEKVKIKYKDIKIQFEHTNVDIDDTFLRIIFVLKGDTSGWTKFNNEREDEWDDDDSN